MTGLVGKSLIAAGLTVVWFLPYFVLIRPRLHRAVDGGVTSVLTMCTPLLSSSLAARLGWSPAGPQSLLDYSVECAAVVLTSAVLAGAATYVVGARKRVVT
jgi:hypothetical protein